MTQSYHWSYFSNSVLKTVSFLKLNQGIVLQHSNWSSGKIYNNKTKFVSGNISILVFFLSFLEISFVPNFLFLFCKRSK